VRTKLHSGSGVMGLSSHLEGASDNGCAFNTVIFIRGYDLGGGGVELATGVMGDL
jgi:hypothetical protein